MELFSYIPVFGYLANKCLLKLVIETLEKGVKYVQS